MKRMVAGLMVLSLLAVLLAAPAPADARPRFWGGFGGFAAGAVTGVVLGSIFAPRVVYSAPPVVYEPAPVYVEPAPVYAPAPVCQDYWVPNQYRGSVWVQAHWERYCR
jgi:hypothetical protein